MFKKLLIAFALCNLLLACGEKSPPSSAPKEAETPVPAAEQAPSPASSFEREIGSSQGVVVLTDKYGEEDTIRIFDREGSVWYEFSYYDENGFDELENINTDFKPFAFHPDYLLLAMRVVGEDGRRWEVVVNEESDLRKFVRKDDENLAYEEFGPHILTVFAVEFDPLKNPLRAGPDGEKLAADHSAIPRFEPVKIEGDWLQVKWNAAGEESKKKEKEGEGPPSGWVKWRDGSKMLIKLYYLS